VLSPVTALQPVGDLLDTTVTVIALVPVAPLPPPLPGTVVPSVLPPGAAPSPTAPGSPPTPGADATTTSGTDAPEPPLNGALTLPGTALRTASDGVAGTTAADAVRQHDDGPAPGSPAPPRTPLPAPTPVTYTGPGDTGSPCAHAVAVTCLPLDLPAATAAQIRPVRAPRGSSNAPDTRPG
jgi:hypothetical protein